MNPIERKIAVASPGIWLEALIKAKNLARGSRGHGCGQERVPQPNLSNFLLYRLPVPQTGRGNAPEIELQEALAGRTSRIGFIMAFLLRYLGRSFQSAMVDSFKNLDVQFLGLGRVERHAERHESISEALHTNPNWAMAHVRTTSFRDGIVVDVDDLVQVVRDNLGDIVESLEVVLAVGDESWEGDRRQVANGRLVR